MPVVPQLLDRPWCCVRQAACSALVGAGRKGVRNECSHRPTEREGASVSIMDRFFATQARMSVDRRNRPGNDLALVASANKIDLTSEKDRAAHRKRWKSWQKRAWEYYDEIGEIWFAMNFGGNAMKKMIVVPAMITDNDKPPVPLEDGDDWYDETTELLSRMRGNDGTIGDLLKSMYICLATPGEGYLVITGMDTPQEEWNFYNSEQLFINSNGRWAIRQSELDHMGEELNSSGRKGGDHVVRIWRSHPRWKEDADSAMKAILMHCDELLILSKQIRATGRSRLPAGVFLAPKEAHPPKPKQPRNTVGGSNAAEENPFVDDFITAMVTPVEDEASVASIAPTIFLVPAQYLKDDLYKYINFGREMDDTAALQRKELIQRIANGIDMPADVLLGKSNMNHWSAWQVDDDTFKSHLEPDTMFMMSALTKAVLRQFLPDAPQELVFWFNPQMVVSHPNKSADADEAFDRMAISWDAYRLAKGFTEDDAPTPEEIDKRIEIDRAKRVRSNEVANGQPAGAQDTTKAPPDTGASQNVTPLRIARND